MSRITVVFLGIIAWCASGMAQSNGVFDVSLETQAYPTGIIPGIRAELGMAQKSAVHLRLGYNWIRHRDLGVHEDERGYGFGFTLGYKRYFKTSFNGLFIGARNDIWWNSLDWKDNIDTPVEVSGHTDIIVVQPTLEGGYLFLFEQGLIVTPTIAFGFEINVKTDGEEVGEGAILLVGVQVGKRF